MRSANPSSLPAEGRPDDSLNARLRVTIVDPDGHELTFTQKIEDRS